MKSKTPSHHPAALAKAAALGIALAGLSVTTQAQTTWDGGGGTNVLNTATNWTTDTLPTTSATWDGTASGGLSLLWNANLGDAANGMSLNLNAGQTGSVILNAADGTSALSIANITLASGVAGLTIGNGDGTAATTVFRGASNTLTNNSGNTVTFQSDVLFSSGGGATRTLTFAGSGSWVFNSGLYAQGTGGLSLNVNGTSTTTVTLNAASTAATTSVAINFGTLRLTNGDALGVSGGKTLNIANGGGTKQLALSNDITLNGTAIANILIAATNTAFSDATTAASILNESGSNVITGNILVSYGGANINLNSQAGTLTLNGSVSLQSGITSARTVNFAGAGDFIVNGTLTGGTGLLGINKMGTGTMTVTHANTYTEGTTVTAGTFLVNNTSGSGTGTGAVTVTGATLGGTGSMGGALTVNSGGILAPGAGGIESLGSGSLTLNDGSTFAVELNTSNLTADLLFASGADASLNLNGNVTLSLTDLGDGSALAPGTKLTLISYNTGWNNGTFAGLADDSILSFAGREWLINYNDTTAGSNFNADAVAFGTSFVTLTVIPEPSTCVLIIGLACLGGALVRRGCRRHRLARR